jgi:hypothetical protein
LTDAWSNSYVPERVPIWGAIDAWCRQWLNDDPREILFQAGHLSTVTGLRLSSGRAVVLKVRPTSERLKGCIHVQRHLWRAGFPCPEPLAGPAPFGELAATAEVLVVGGDQLAWSADTPTMFANALARLVAQAPPPGSLHGLDQSPPWVGWDHPHSGVWPDPDDLDADLNDHVGPDWIEDAGARVRRRLLQPSALPLAVGHGDWESQNLRWTADSRLHVVHDWDSVIVQREATIAGAASAVYTATGAPNTSASVEQSQAFLTAYELARGQPWSTEERELSWAAGLWVRVFNAKKASVRRGTAPPSASTLRLHAELDSRLRHAGA